MRILNGNFKFRIGLLKFRFGNLKIYIRQLDKLDGLFRNFLGKLRKEKWTFRDSNLDCIQSKYNKFADIIG